MSELDAWFQALITDSNDRAAALHDAYQHLENAGLLNRVVVHRYLCAKGNCKLATVVKIGDSVIARTKDYKFSPGVNAQRSVESARGRNTLDGERHWPGHTFDVSDLAGWGDQAGLDMNCRHVLRTVMANDILAAVEGIAPGHPAAPSRI